MPAIDLPPLAIYRRVSDYVPAYGDFIVWSGWISSWHGVVSYSDPESNNVSVIFSTLPFLLFTMDNKMQEKETRILPLAFIRNSSNGVFAICQHDYIHNATIWYI